MDGISRTGQTGKLPAKRPLTVSMKGTVLGRERGVGLAVNTPRQIDLELCLPSLLGSLVFY